MKKFLSLVLALVMTMSLVTVGAGATEYKDLTDKGEIQYEEAVAVLNKLGIITGYTDGSFQPAGALTRGAAAKIIVSLMQGADFASSLTVAAAPYKDVAVDNTFAAVISYCKTAGYINGYSDGTFRPTAPLTGYAFSKMLLGALGYDGVQEKFTGNGWTMNVANLGSNAGLFNGFKDGFKGNDGLTREGACQLALNTLKATMVEYSGGTNITTSAGDANTTIVTDKTRSYKVSNNDTINHNINKSQSGNNANYLTLEFGEEHFQNLVLDNVKYGKSYEDDYGRPSNRWSLKNVVIGTYAKTANYTFTEGADGDTNTDKVKDMGLNSYDVCRDGVAKNTQTLLTVNGENRSAAELVNGKTTLAANAKALTNYVKNGSLVEVYLDEDDANVISHIAVTQTQIMQVNRVASGDVTLKKVEDQGVKADNTAVAVNAVKNDDVLYNVLKDLKADDYVVVTPLWVGANSWDVDGIFVPTTATGSITKVKVNSNGGEASGLTVADTDYKMSRNWTAEDAGSNRAGALGQNSVSSRQESTVYIDAYGFAIYVSNVKASTAYFMFDECYANTVNGRIHWLAQGWDTKGNEVSLDVGTQEPKLIAGKVYAYKTATSNSNADYQVYTDATKVMERTAAINANDTQIGGKYFTSGVKFLFPTWNGSDIDTVTVKDGAQKVASTAFQYVLDGSTPAKITAVFLSNDNDVEVSQNVLYIQKQTAVTQDKDGKNVSIFTAYIDGVKTTDLVANKLISDNTFYTYKVDETTGIYTVNAYNQPTGKTTSVLTNAQFNKGDLASNAYLNAGTLLMSTGEALDKNLNLSNTVVIDLRTGGTLSSAKDMAENPDTGVMSYTVSLVYNDSNSSSIQGRVGYLFILSSSSATVTITNLYTASVAGFEFKTDTTNWSDTIKFKGTENIQVRPKNPTMLAYEVVRTYYGATFATGAQKTIGTRGQYGEFQSIPSNVTGITLNYNSVNAIHFNSNNNNVFLDLTGAPTDKTIAGALDADLTAQGCSGMNYTGFAAGSTFTMFNAAGKLVPGTIQMEAARLPVEIIHNGTTYDYNAISTETVATIATNLGLNLKGTGSLYNSNTYAPYGNTVAKNGKYVTGYVAVVPSTVTSTTPPINGLTAAISTDVAYVPAAGGTVVYTVTLNGTTGAGTPVTVTAPYEGTWGGLVGGVTAVDKVLSVAAVTTLNNNQFTYTVTVPAGDIDVAAATFAIA